jgi:hypothetical protein
LIQWARFSFLNTDAMLNISFPSSFPTRCVSVITNGIGDGRHYSSSEQTEAYVDNITSSGFTAYGDSTARSHTYIAIGY